MRLLVAGVLALCLAGASRHAGAAKEQAAKKKVARDRRGSAGPARASTPRGRTRTTSRLGRDMKRPKMTEFVKGLAVDNELPVDRGQGNFVYRDHRGLAELTYTIRRNDTVMYLIHTGVRGALKGQGAGKRLVEEAVIWAAKEGLKIAPACEFARREFDKAKKRGDERYAAVEYVAP